MGRLPTARTALVVLVPALERVVGADRPHLDRGASLGVPAHVTILFPFLPPERLDDAVRDELVELVGAHPCFDVTFDSVQWFGDDVAYLRPTPDEPFRRLTAAVWRRWPDHPPYAGTVPDPIPHLTLGDGGRSPELEAAAERVAGELPVSTRITEVHLMRGTDETASWSQLATFRLG